MYTLKEQGHLGGGRVAHGHVEGTKVGSKKVCSLILQREAVPCNTTAETDQDKNSFVTDPGTGSACNSTNSLIMNGHISDDPHQI